MLKKFIGTALVLSSLAAAIPALAAENMHQDSAAMVSTAISCVAPVVTTRETAIGAAFSAFSTAQSSALSTRQAALRAAWSKTTVKDVRAGVQDAWKAYRTAHSAAVKTHRQAVKAAWVKFRTDAKVCHPTKGVPVESGNASDDSLAQ